MFWDVVDCGSLDVSFCLVGPQGLASSYFLQNTI